MAILRTVTHNAVIASDVSVAHGEAARLRGFLGRTEIGDNEGLWFAKTRMIHTAGMKTAIDIIFVDRNLRVVHIDEYAGAWRIFGSFRAAHAIELAPGAVQRTGLALGDLLALEVPNLAPGSVLTR